MIETSTELPAHLQRLVKVGVTGIDIMHGQLKMDMLEAQSEFHRVSEIEEENGYSDAMESMERKYMEGYLDALVYCYKLTYDISFEEGVIKSNKEDGHL